MAREPPPPGSIIQYPYVWASQRDAGETEGRKSRPVCLVLRLRASAKDIHHLVLLLPSPASRRRADQRALEVPATERRRAGLTHYPRAWIVVSEYTGRGADPRWDTHTGKLARAAKRGAAAAGRCPLFSRFR